MIKPPFRQSLVTLLLIAACAIPARTGAEKHLKNNLNPKVLASQLSLPGPSYAQRTDVGPVADDIALQHQLDASWVRQTLAQARYIPAIAKAIAPPPVGTPKNWRVYRSRFVEPIRIRAGLAFWQAHADTLARAERQTGVPAAIIVGIIGIETVYGQQMGHFRVIDALATLAFDFPASHPRAAQRSAYFKQELGHYLSLVQRTGEDPQRLLGSYAGAMGMPQFMPSSWAKYATDFDADGRIDLFASANDAIGSVASYFTAFGWKKDLPTHYPVSFDAQKLDLPALLEPDILPTFSVASFQDKGAVLDAGAQRHAGKLALVELQNGADAPSYVAGTDNFYVITRYNWSSYYAMAVIELGQAVMQARLLGAGQIGP
ncbi:MAG: lytic murein transglycosylase B [Rhodoferax sp.]